MNEALSIPDSLSLADALKVLSDLFRPGGTREDQLARFNAATDQQLVTGLAASVVVRVQGVDALGIAIGELLATRGISAQALYEACGAEVADEAHIEPIDANPNGRIVTLG
jgi:hypothetical protein